jgi:hypothetical protein
MDTIRDFLGQPIRVGDRIVYDSGDAFSMGIVRGILDTPYQAVLPVLDIDVIKHGADKRFEGIVARTPLKPGTFVRLD